MEKNRTTVAFGFMLTNCCFPFLMKISALRQTSKHFRFAVGEACQELDPRIFDAKVISRWFPCLQRLNISCCGQV